MTALVLRRADNSVNSRLCPSARQELEPVADIDDKSVRAVPDVLPLAVVVVAELERRHRLGGDEGEG